MKSIEALDFPQDVRYTDDHEWARREADQLVVGISDYAQDQLGDIVFVELPETGQRIGKGEEFGTVESVKAVSELYLPVGGEIVAVNEALADAPEQVNSDPYGKGWMVAVRPDDEQAFEALMSAADYQQMLKG